MNLLAKAVVEDLGRALVSHPSSGRLRYELRSGALDAQVVYRAIVQEVLGAVVRVLAEARVRGEHGDVLTADALGALYEDFLEMHAEVDPRAGVFTVSKAAGHDRKTSGSYYTHPSLVDCLLGMALDPALDEAARAADPEAAILSLKVCDPACGSGRFLLAAARRMGARLAAVRMRERNGGGEGMPAGELPSDELLRAKADVIDQCLYGVDLSPVAVEICRASLWLEAPLRGRGSAGRSEKIRQGNALLGATPELFQRGIPNAVFVPVEGDDRGAALRLKKKNRAARATRSMGEVISSVRAPDRAAADRMARGALSDVFCAALFWPLLPGPLEESAITEDVFQLLVRGAAALSPLARQVVAELADQYGFFHWDLAFPEVFGARGGFDVIVGNPPWGRLTVSDEEWFARRDAGIAGIKGKPRRDQAIGALSTIAPVLAAAYKAAKREAELLDRFFSPEIGAFPLTGHKELNTYPLFAELAERLVSPGGRVGLIVKTGIGAAESCLPLFRRLVEERRLEGLFDFVNAKRLFPGVQAVERFSLMTFRGAGAGAVDLRAAALCRDVVDLDAPGRVYALSKGDIALLSPSNGACPFFRSERDVEIMRRLYRSFPTLGERDDARPDDLWNLEHTSIFHMSDDSGAFVTEEELAASGARSIGSQRYRVGGEEYWPLYEGKYIYLLDHRYGTFDAVPRERRFGRKAEARRPSPSELADPGYELTPRYWFPKSSWLKRAARRRLSGAVQFIYRDIAGVYPDHRTAIGALVPAGPAGNSCPRISLGGVGGRAGALRLLAFAALFCSIPFDYIVRSRLFSKHINPNVLGQLVMPPPRAVVPEEGERGTLRSRLCEAALALTYTSESLRPLGELLGAPKPFVFDEGRRWALLREIDAIAAHLYGMSREELGHALGSFETLHAAEERALGEARTRRRVLEQF